MIVSIQTWGEAAQVWDDNSPVIHKVEDWAEAVSLAYAISHQGGNKTVRLVAVNGSNELPKIEIPLAKYIGNKSGTYIQSNA